MAKRFVQDSFQDHACFASPESTESVYRCLGNGFALRLKCKLCLNLLILFITSKSHHLDSLTLCIVFFYYVSLICVLIFVLWCTGFAFGLFIVFPSSPVLSFNDSSVLFLTFFLIQALRGANFTHKTAFNVLPKVCCVVLSFILIFISFLISPLTH